MTTATNKARLARTSRGTIEARVDGRAAVTVDAQYLADAIACAADYLATGNPDYRDAMFHYLWAAGGLFTDRIHALAPLYPRGRVEALALDVIRLGANVIGYEGAAAATIAAVARPGADS